MKLLLTIWISAAVLAQEVFSSTLVRYPRDAVTKPTSSVHTEYEATYEQKGKHGNGSYSTVSGKQEVVHDNCHDNWNAFADKCASLIKDLVASLGNAVSSKPGDATNLQLRIRNTFKHFDSTDNCSCLINTKNSLSSLFDNIIITTVQPPLSSEAVANHQSGSGEIASSAQGTDGNNGQLQSRTCDSEFCNSQSAAVDPKLVQQRAPKPNLALTNAENVDPELADTSKELSTANSRRGVQHPEVITSGIGGNGGAADSVSEQPSPVSRPSTQAKKILFPISATPAKATESPIQVVIPQSRPQLTRPVVPPQPSTAQQNSFETTLPVQRPVENTGIANSAVLVKPVPATPVADPMPKSVYGALAEPAIKNEEREEEKASEPPQAPVAPAIVLVPEQMTGNKAQPQSASSISEGTPTAESAPSAVIIPEPMSTSSVSEGNTDEKCEEEKGGESLQTPVAAPVVSIPESESGTMAQPQSTSDVNGGSPGTNSAGSAVSLPELMNGALADSNKDGGDKIKIKTKIEDGDGGDKIKMKAKITEDEDGDKIKVKAKYEGVDDDGNKIKIKTKIEEDNHDDGDKIKIKTKIEEDHHDDGDKTKIKSKIEEDHDGDKIKIKSKIEEDHHDDGDKIKIKSKIEEDHDGDKIKIKTKIEEDHHDDGDKIKIKTKIEEDHHNDGDKIKIKSKIEEDHHDDGDKIKIKTKIEEDHHDDGDKIKIKSKIEEDHDGDKIKIKSKIEEDHHDDGDKIKIKTKIEEDHHDDGDKTKIKSKIEEDHHDDGDKIKIKTKIEEDHHDDGDKIKIKTKIEEDHHDDGDKIKIKTKIEEDHHDDGDKIKIKTKIEDDHDDGDKIKMKAKITEDEDKEKLKIKTKIEEDGEKIKMKAKITENEDGDKLQVKAKYEGVDDDGNKVKMKTKIEKDEDGEKIKTKTKIEGVDDDGDKIMIKTKFEGDKDEDCDEEKGPESDQTPVIPPASSLGESLNGAGGEKQFTSTNGEDNKDAAGNASQSDQEVVKPLTSSFQDPPAMVSDDNTNFVPNLKSAVVPVSNSGDSQIPVITQAEGSSQLPLSEPDDSALPQVASTPDANVIPGLIVKQPQPEHFAQKNPSAVDPVTNSHSNLPDSTGPVRTVNPSPVYQPLPSAPSPSSDIAIITNDPQQPTTHQEVTPAVPVTTEGDKTTQNGAGGSISSVKAIPVAPVAVTRRSQDPANILSPATPAEEEDEKLFIVTPVPISPPTDVHEMVKSGDHYANPITESSGPTPGTAKEQSGQAGDTQSLQQRPLSSNRSNQKSAANQPKQTTGESVPSAPTGSQPESEVFIPALPLTQTSEDTDQTKPTTFQTTSTDPTPPQQSIQSPPPSKNSLSLTRPPSTPQNSHETSPHIVPLTSPRTVQDDDDDDDDDDDCCSCESCTEEEITNPKQYKEMACKDLEEARKELKAIFDKIKKRLKCGKKAPQQIAAS